MGLKLRLLHRIETYREDGAVYAHVPGTEFSSPAEEMLYLIRRIPHGTSIDGERIERKYRKTEPEDGIQYKTMV